LQVNLSFRRYLPQQIQWCYDVIRAADDFSLSLLPVNLLVCHTRDGNDIICLSLFTHRLCKRNSMD